MTHDEAVEILKIAAKMHSEVRGTKDMIAVPKTSGVPEALDIAIAVMERETLQSAPENLTIEGRKVDNMATQFEERVAELFSTDVWLMERQRQVRTLIHDMQAHIRKLEASLEIADDTANHFKRSYENVKKTLHVWQDDCRRLDADADKVKDILSELVKLRHIKITQGKTPGYLERQPKAWQRAEEAVK